NPETGRFLTRDTFEGVEDEPLSLNRYTYAENNPVMSVDPDGYSKKRISLQCIIKAIKYAFRYWLAGYLGWQFAGNIIDKFFALGGAALTMRSVYRVEYKHYTRHLRMSSIRSSLSRVFTYSTIKQARRIALKAAIKAGMRVIPFAFVTDVWNLSYGAYLGWRRYCR
ncbi:MAG: hypothetical protein LOD89_07045, partial [Tissierellales bacterium]